MQKTKQTRNGKSFEYACLKAIKNECINNNVQIRERTSPSLDNAKNSYNSLTEQDKKEYDLAAYAPVSFLIGCEPNLEDAADSASLTIGLQSDSMGQSGDVRDVLLCKTDPNNHSNNWECGISCKHNHDATKHPRINFQPRAKDLFKTSWARSFTMSQEYFDACEKVYDICKEGINGSMNWNAVFSEKELASQVYKPINSGLMKSIDDLKT